MSSRQDLKYILRWSPRMPTSNQAFTRVQFPTFHHLYTDEIHPGAIRKHLGRECCVHRPFYFTSKDNRLDAIIGLVIASTARLRAQIDRHRAQAGRPRRGPAEIVERTYCEQRTNRVRLESLGAVPEFCGSG